MENTYKLIEIRESVGDKEGANKARMEWMAHNKAIQLLTNDEYAKEMAKTFEVEIN